jgi:hypothetical protein
MTIGVDPDEFRARDWFERYKKMRFVPRSGDLLRFWRSAATAVLAAAPLGCAVSPQDGAENPFVGNWATAENASITIRQETVVQHQPDGQSTTLDRSACRGVFSFAYGTKTREALADLLPRQPELQRRLSDTLVEPNYRVAQLDCDHGDQTYVLLNDRQLLAIYRDGDIGVIDRLARR